MYSTPVQNASLLPHGLLDYFIFLLAHILFFSNVLPCFELLFFSLPSLVPHFILIFIFYEWDVHDWNGHGETNINWL